MSTILFHRRFPHRLLRHFDTVHRQPKPGHCSDQTTVRTHNPSYSVTPSDYPDSIRTSPKERVRVRILVGRVLEVRSPLILIGRYLPLCLCLRLSELPSIKRDPEGFFLRRELDHMETLVSLSVPRCLGVWVVVSGAHLILDFSK